MLNHVLLHQTVIGLEAIKQFALAEDYPDMVFAPCGGGSNFGGVAFPFLADKACGKPVRLVAVEPSSCPTLTRGHYAYDFGDTAGLTPLMKQYNTQYDLRRRRFTPEACAITAPARWSASCITRD